MSRRQLSRGATGYGGERRRTIAVAMVLACCCRGGTRRRRRRRGPDPAAVVSPYDNLDMRERARVDAHDIRVLTVGMCAVVRHERRKVGVPRV